MSKSIGLLISLVLCVVSFAAIAQPPNAGLANAIMAARQKSNAMMLQYSWNARSEIMVDGSVKDTKIQQVSYLPNGSPQYVLINDTPAKVPGLFLRKAIAADKKEELEKYMKGLEGLIGQYTLPGPGAMGNFIAGATIAAGTSPEGKAILTTTGNGVVVPGDTLSLTFDAGSFAILRAEITTTFDNHSVTISATYRTLPSGLTHLQFASVEVPSKKLSLQVHNYDYVPND